MKTKTIQRMIGAFVLLISSIQMIITTQVSVSFWDPGELSAAAYRMQVPHPPGGPLFSLVGRIFYMLPIPGSLGFRMNLVSALASAFTVFFLYLIIVKIIEAYKGKTEVVSFDSISTYIIAAIGALTLSFSDTFWFNAAEANYFASSTFLYASMLLLMLIWNEHADEPGSERYLLLIAYIAGLSGGLHLMSVLTIVIVGIWVVLRKYVTNDEECLQSLYVLIGHAVFLFVIAAILWGGETDNTPPTAAALQAFESKFKIAMIIGTVIVLGFFRKKIFVKSSYYLGVLVGGIGLAVVFPGIIRYLPTTLLTVAGDNLQTGMFILISLFAIAGFGVYWALKRKMQILALSLAAVIMAVLGVTTYTMIVIRANANLPMNENHPQSFAHLISYLNREQYGDFPMFKRRWSSEPEKAEIFSNYTSDFDFFWRWQMGHMFHRYVGWNFIGRISHDQDAGVNWKEFFGIPFLMGLWGLYYSTRKNWKLGSLLIFTFILMGYLITYYQNQQLPQPRDREYFYCGAYLIFTIWIALGIRGLFDLIFEKLGQLSSARPLGISLLVLSALFIPGRMLQANYTTHDRSKNWVPWDFAYNLLQTCEPDAILFTQGDNDTFPLWYMQDVEGVRRDVRIVNLSLGNTSWYLLQMKHIPAYPEAKAVPMNMPDSYIEEIQPIQWEPRNLRIPVDKETIDRYQETTHTALDTSITNHGAIIFFMKNTLQFGSTKALRVQDIAVYDIILANEWKRPIYFAATCSPDAKIGLDEYLSFKGLAWKLEPRKASQFYEGIDPVILEANLLHEPSGYSTKPQYGYKFRETANPEVFFDENTSRIMLNYRSAFTTLAAYYMNFSHDAKKAVDILDRMDALIPIKKTPLGWEYAMNIATIYHMAGRSDRVKELSSSIEPECLNLINSGEVNTNTYLNPFRALLELYDMTKEYDKEIGLLQKLQTLYPNDPGVKQRIQALEQLKASAAQVPAK